MTRNSEISTKIFELLKKNGAELGNMSVILIESVLNEHDTINGVHHEYVSIDEFVAHGGVIADDRELFVPSTDPLDGLTLATSMDGETTKYVKINTIPIWK